MEKKRRQRKRNALKRRREVNSMHEENDVSNRHMTWWRDAWWVRMDNGPHLRTARGRRRVWRASHESRAGSARDRTGRRGRKGERGARDNGEKRKQHTTRCLPLPKRKHNTLNNSNQHSKPQQSQQPQRQQQQCACSDGHGYHCDGGQRDRIRHLPP